jgi:hypothetical protein
MVGFQESGPARVVSGEIGGLPAYWIEADGPCYAGLTFRVGQADETVPTRGLTHLVEHLAMHSVGDPPYQCNASVGLTTTDFYARGSSQEMAQFLEAVCRGLSDLPLGRTRLEARVLRTEAAGGSSGIDARMAWLRFGNTGQGLSWLPEFYFRNPRPEPVRDWTAERFTRDNCALWFVGRLPSEMRLNLPSGRRFPFPTTTRIRDLQLPAAIRGDGEAVTISLESPRTSAATAALRIAMARIRADARMERGLIYRGDWNREPLSTERALDTLWVTCMKEHAAEVLDRLMAVLEDIAARGPTDLELEEDLTATVRDIEDPDSRPQEVSGWARYAVTGFPILSSAEILEEQRRLTASDCAQTLGDAFATAILAIPPVARKPQGFSDYPISADIIEGRTFSLSNVKQDKGNRLIIGPEGISLVGAKGASTVRWQACVAFILEGEGEWSLLDANGFAITIRPDEFDDIEDIRHMIDDALPIPIRIGTQS